MSVDRAYVLMGFLTVIVLFAAGFVELFTAPTQASLYFFVGACVGFGWYGMHAIGLWIERLGG